MVKETSPNFKLLHTMKASRVSHFLMLIAYIMACSLHSQVFTNVRMDKENVMNTYNGISLALKRKEILTDVTT